MRRCPSSSSHNACTFHLFMWWNRLCHSCPCVNALLTQTQRCSLFTWRWSPKDHRCVCDDTARLISLSTLISYATEIRHTGKRIIHAVSQHVWWSYAKVGIFNRSWDVLTNSFLSHANSAEVWYSCNISFTDKLRCFHFCFF